MVRDPLRKFIREAMRPAEPGSAFAHARRANDYLDEAVEHLESLARVRPDLEPVVADLIGAVQNVQSTIDRFKIEDERFKKGV